MVRYELVKEGEEGIPTGRLVALKGEEKGLVYAPYIPVVKTPEGVTMLGKYINYPSSISFSFVIKMPEVIKINNMLKNFYY